MTRVLVAGFIFTTSLRPALLAGALASERWFRGRNDVRTKHQEPANKF